MTSYDPRTVEDAWRGEVNSPLQAKSGASAFYVLEMFPYPSGVLHVGHIRNYTIGDTIARFKSQQGFNVLHPMGFDAFGLPAENASIQSGESPEIWTRKNILNFHATFSRFGMSYDWAREVVTCDTGYMKVQQQLFKAMHGAGLVYQSETMVNWDPIDHTVLANEQVVNGLGWRSGAVVEQRLLKQWFFRITQYAEELMDTSGISKWPEKVRLMQENWIGRTEGVKIALPVVGTDAKLEAFTPVPEQLFGVTFVGVGPSHPVLAHSVHVPELEAFRHKCAQRGTSTVGIEKGEKEGMMTGLEAVHPLTGRRLPVVAVNFLTAEREAFAYLGVPAHDASSYQVAVGLGLEIRRVVTGSEGVQTPQPSDILVNSVDFTGMSCQTAKGAIVTDLKRRGIAQEKVIFRLRDWGISRQRYWGCPIPVIHCETCGPVLVPDKDLPVTLPPDVVIDGRGNPLQKHATWKHVDCPCCRGAALRETDTMDTFVDSSWYFLRFAAPETVDLEDLRLAVGFMPVGLYIGGIEHAILHLLYARFITKVLRDIGILPGINEPFQKLLTQGMVLHSAYKDQSGHYVELSDVSREGGRVTHVVTGEHLLETPLEKMSKSKRNGISPESVADRYGADAVRMYILFSAPMSNDVEWEESKVVGTSRFLKRVWELVMSLPVRDGPSTVSDDGKLILALNKTIVKVTSDMERQSFNTAVAALMEFSRLVQAHMEKGLGNAVLQQALRALVLMLAPMSPFIARALWRVLEPGMSIEQAGWPALREVAEGQVEVKTIIVQVDGKIRERLQLPEGTPEEEVVRQATLKLGTLPVLNRTVFVPNRLVNFVTR